MNIYFTEIKKKLTNKILEFKCENSGMSHPVNIKVTRRTEYGDRYRLFVIDKKSFENQYSLEDAGITLKNIDSRITVDNLKWNGIAKKWEWKQEM